MFLVRSAEPEDAERLLEIYDWYVKNTAVSFEWTSPGLEEFRGRMRRTLRKYPYLVIVEDGKVQGYAYAGPFVGREAYAWSAELTIYLDHRFRRCGMGKMLYGALEEELRRRGCRNLYACIGLPEVEDEYLTRDSAAFHARMGFTLAGTFTNCGHKFGRWYHMIWMEKIIGPHGEDRKPDSGSPCRVLCIGQAVIDCITRGQEADKHRENVFRADRIEMHIGGDAVNESVALCELGHRAAIVCGVGEDLAGNVLRAELEKRGVDTSGISVMRTLTTPVAQLVVHQDGGRHSINSRATMLEGYVPFADCAADGESALLPGAVGTFSAGGGKAAPEGSGATPLPGAAGAFLAGGGKAAPEGSGATPLPGAPEVFFAGGGEALPSAGAMRAAMEGVRIVSLASLFRAPLDRPEVIRCLVRAAKEAGALVCADTKLPTFREVPLEALADVWPLIDYIFPNEKEAAYYTGKTDFAEMAAAFRSMGVHNVIIKAGPEGCYVNGENGIFHLPALPVEVVDSTGAGDNFVAGFISGLLQGEDLRACAERGRARASECISRMGAGG